MPEHEELNLVIKFDYIRLEGLPDDEAMVHFEWFIMNHRVIFTYLTVNSYCFTFLFNVEREIPSTLADLV